MTVTLDLHDGLATVTLDRPDAANAFDLAQARDLAACAADLGSRDDVRSVLLIGAGARFCAGGDVLAMASAEESGAFIASLADQVHTAVLALDRLSVPVVCAVQGAAAGAGLALTLVCDVVVAEEDAVFLTAYSALALTPDCGMTWTLPRVVGARRAAEMLLLNRRLRADEALDWGLVTQVVPRGAATPRARELALHLAGGPASGSTRRLMRDSFTSDLAEHLDAERDAIRAAASAGPAQQLLHSFAASR